MKDYLNLSDDLAFYTLEGEGEMLGKPSVFLRLSSCNLTCKGFATDSSPHGCDSYVSWKIKNKFTFEQLQWFFKENDYIDKLKKGALLKLTGGEPLLQRAAFHKWLEYFIEQNQFMPRVDVETNGTIMPEQKFWDLKNHEGERYITFTVSPKLSNNGDAERVRYKPDVLRWHNERKACFKFVIKDEADLDEIYAKYIDNGLVDKKRIWLMPCCGSRKEHIEIAPYVAELAKANNMNFSPRLQLLLWDQALKV